MLSDTVPEPSADRAGRRRAGDKEERRLGHVA